MNRKPVHLKQNPTSTQLDPSVVVPDTDSSAMEKDLYDLEILRQPKHGPLDIYRKKASFDWRKMRIFMDGEEIYACMDETSCNALYMHVFGYIPVG
jgi:hypothetical protein